jgi:hypothetical protein
VTNLDAEALLITGVYGTGKTSVVEEIADVLESGRVPYAALDLDWLGWADSGKDATETSGDWQGHGHSTMLANLFCVVNNYLDAGIRRFVMGIWPPVSGRTQRHHRHLVDAGSSSSA